VRDGSIPRDLALRVLVEVTSVTWCQVAGPQTWVLLMRKRFGVRKPRTLQEATAGTLFHGIGAVVYRVYDRAGGISSYLYSDRLTC